MQRRDLFAVTAAVATATVIKAAEPKMVAIASANGLQATAKAVDLMKAGVDTLDAVVAGVNIVEDDPNDDSVGYGGLPNENGIVELDASVMHGPTRRAGSVASVRNIKNPSKLAKLVMEQTDHVMLVGNGALEFAKAWGFKEENLLTENSRKAWMIWKQSLKDARGYNNWTDGLDAPKPSAGAATKAILDQLQQRFPGESPEFLAYAWSRAIKPITGTINCLALNSKGEMSGCTTTSGLSWKIAGRVGDSPIIGAGLYVDQEIGAGGSTGRGEENIRVCGAHSIVENLRHGMAPKDAVMDVLKRISRNYNHDLEKLKNFNIQFYALRKDGVFAAASMWGSRTKPDQYAVNSGDGPSRLENCQYLYERT
jgi:N4-(beta-N-acetylglucosaminyl)-L-asparaginase